MSRRKDYQPWAYEDDVMLRALYPLHDNHEIGRRMGRTEPAILNRAHKLGLKKPGGYTGPSVFKPGHQTWNKGMKGLDIGGKATRFKPGNLTGRANQNHKPIGTERTSKDGYLERKIHDGMPLQSRWRAVHIINWEALHGPLPAGHALVFRDGDKANVAPENMELVTRAELMRRNSKHNLPPEWQEIVTLRSRITKRINRMRSQNHVQKND